MKTTYLPTCATWAGLPSEAMTCSSVRAPRTGARSMSTKRCRGPSSAGFVYQAVLQFHQMYGASAPPAPDNARTLTRFEVVTVTMEDDQYEPYPSVREWCCSQAASSP